MSAQTNAPRPWASWQFNAPRRSRGRDSMEAVRSRNGGILQRPAALLMNFLEQCGCDVKTGSRRVASCILRFTDITLSDCSTSSASVGPNPLFTKIRIFPPNQGGPTHTKRRAHARTVEKRRGCALPRRPPRWHSTRARRADSVNGARGAGAGPHHDQAHRIDRIEGEPRARSESQQPIGAHAGAQRSGVSEGAYATPLRTTVDDGHVGWPPRASRSQFY